MKRLSLPLTLVDEGTDKARLGHFTNHACAHEPVHEEGQTNFHFLPGCFSLYTNGGKLGPT